MKKLIAMIMLSLLAASPGMLSAKIYKWTDKEGNVHYGERPAGNNAREMVIRKGPPAPAPTEEPVDRKETREKLLDDFAKQREDKAKSEEEADKEKALRTENCSRARKNLASLKSGGQRSEISETGERTFFNEEKIQQLIQQSEKDVAEWCE